MEVVLGKLDPQKVKLLQCLFISHYFFLFDLLQFLADSKILIYKTDFFTTLKKELIAVFKLTDHIFF